MKKLNQLHNKMKESTKEYYNLFHKEMNKFKERFFKLDEGDVVKISILKVLNEDWDNCMSYIRCYYCKDKYGSWHKIDEKQDFKYEMYDLEKLKQAEEIDREEYQRLRELIIEKVNNEELEKLHKKMKTLKDKYI